MGNNGCCYLRVSTLDQQYDRQEIELKEYAKDLDVKIVKVFAEKESGTKDDREQLKIMLDYVTNPSNDIQFVLIHELTRFGRTYEIHRNVEILTKAGVCLCSRKEKLKTLLPSGEPDDSSGLLLGFLANIASYELKTMKYRSISGMLNSARNGKARAIVNYGYSKDKETKKLIINEEEADVIKMIFQKYIDGDGCRTISNYLNNKGIPSHMAASQRKKEFIEFKKGYKKHISEFNWTESTIQSILRNPIYTGNRKYKNEVVPSPQIIDESIYQQAQQIMKDKANKFGINKKYSHLFQAGKVKCPLCGKNYFVETRKDKQTAVYKCLSQRYKGQNCGNYGISYNKLNQAVIKTILSRPLYILNLIENVNENDLNLKRIEELKANIIGIQARIKEEKNNEDVAEDLALEGLIKKDKLAERLKNIRKNLDKLNENLRFYSSELKDLEEFQVNQSSAKQFFIDLLKSNDFNFNPETISTPLNKVIHKVQIFPVTNIPPIELYKDRLDKFVYIKVLTYLSNIAETFILSQRCNNILLVDASVYDEDKHLVKDWKTVLKVIPEKKQTPQQEIIRDYINHQNNKL